MDKKSYIRVRGANTHNLKGINVDVSRNSLVVVTGISGSGKSSLAFDTIYAESQRRYVESLAITARRLIPLPPRPDVDLIEGLSPSIALEQKSLIQNPRSTVGTLTDIYDYLRVLFAKTGVAFCPDHFEPLESLSITETLTIIKKTMKSKSIGIYATVKEKDLNKEVFNQKIRELKSLGYSKIRIRKKDGSSHLRDLYAIDRKEYEEGLQVDIVIDRLKVTEENTTRLQESLELAMSIEKKIVRISLLETPLEYIFSKKPMCKKCAFEGEDLNTSLFSFNKPDGACEKCKGLGTITDFDLARIVKFPNISIDNGAIPGWDKRNKFNFAIMEGLSKKYNFSLNAKFNTLPKKIKTIILEGEPETNDKKFLGIVAYLTKLWQETKDFDLKNNLKNLRQEMECAVCEGTRLNLRARSTMIKINNEKFTIKEILNYSIKKLGLLLEKKDIKVRDDDPKAQLLFEISNRVSLLRQLGLQYLTLKRASQTLSGGEIQRIRLSSQIGAKLSGITYVLDEPSKGLHVRDNIKLIDALIELKKQGNTVIVVEHDKDMMLSADQIIDLGPGAGPNGGQVLFSGSPKKLLDVKNSKTSEFLKKHTKSLCIDKKSPEKWIVLERANGNNLKNISVSIPINRLVSVTGVSGSGKSTLVQVCLKDSFNNDQLVFSDQNSQIKELDKTKFFEKIISIDQKAIGKTPKSNPATYTGIFLQIREIFASTRGAKEKGYDISRFSFNNESGRCEKCLGEGYIKIDMHFLPDVFSLCNSCDGTRFNQETKQILWRGKSIADVLNMTVEEGCVFFSSNKKISTVLDILKSVGLGYLKLGQSSLTLSGGEAQRIKLAKELAKLNRQPMLYILDEPTTGLHYCEIALLINVLKRLIKLGHSVIVIEHNIEFIVSSDWLIDMGPEGGPEGGEIIAEGTPEDVAKNKKSYTGKYLQKAFNK